MCVTPNSTTDSDAGVHESWYRRMTRGALAGSAATALMSAVQWPLAFASGEDPPPVQIMKRVSTVLPGRTPRTTVVWRGTIAHVAFGAGAGALYGLVAPRRYRDGTGIAYAALIWGTSYLGWLPALRLHPPVARDDRVRQIGNAAGHVVYGIALAEGMRVTQPR